LSAGSRPEEIDALEADIRRLNAHQSYLEDQLKSLKVNSPIAGVITKHKLRQKIGENVKKGDLIAAVNAVKTVTVEIAVTEKEIADVKIGHKVVLKARAYPSTTFAGQVIEVGPFVSKTKDLTP